jgi:hypothetical protein
MIPPTSIDGTDITGATIDGTEVQEITVDGQTVFSATTGNLPVAYSDLVIWYPFDSSFYGGLDTDDVTALFNSAQSGDSTAYNADDNGNTHGQTGVFDINAGLNSGAYKITANALIESSRPPVTQTFTDMVWVKADNFSTGDFQNIIRPEEGGSNRRGLLRFETNSNTVQYGMHDSSGNFTILGDGLGSYNSNQWYHFAWRYDGSVVEVFEDGNLLDLSSYNSTITNSKFGLGGSIFGEELIDGFVDDFRHYNVALTNNEIVQIYNNTDPDQNP